MKDAMKFLFLAAGLCAARSAEAASLYYNLHGNSCFSTTPGLVGNTSNTGVWNPSSTTAMTVSCPLQIPDKIYTQQYIGIAAYNRNINGPVSCTFSMISDDGKGATSATASIVGTGADVKYASARNFPAATHVNPSLTCRIPPLPSGGGSFSFLTSVYIVLDY
jgi:hypothetical protein